MNESLPRYAQRLRALHIALEEDFRKIVHRLPRVKGKVTDVGCGDGFFTKLLGEVHSGVLGIDNSDAYLEEAAANCSKVANVRFIKGDVNELPFEAASVDVVWSAHSMHSYPDVRKALAEFQRVLRPGGLLAVLESDNIHSVMLSWPPDVELAVRQAEHREIGDEDSYIGTYFPRFAMRLFGDAGFENFQREQFLITRSYPPSGPLGEFVKLYLENVIERTSGTLSANMSAKLAQLSDPTRPEYILRSPSFTFSSLQILSLGRAATLAQSLPDATG